MPTLPVPPRAYDIAAEEEHRRIAAEHEARRVAAEEVEAREVEARFQDAQATIIQLSPDEIVPDAVLESLKKAIRLNSDSALNLMATVILKRQHTLSQDEKIFYLQLFAQQNPEDASKLALAHIRSECFAVSSREKNPLDWMVFYYAAILGYKGAFNDLLTAICADKVDISPEEFIKITQDIIEKTNNYETMVIFGGLLCRYASSRWPRLVKLKLDDPELGFEYLLKVLQNLPAGDKLYTRADELLTTGIINNIFTNAYALELRKSYEAFEAAQAANVRPSTP